MQYFYREKIGQKFFGYFGNFQKTAQRKKSHNRRKFAQSGHPDLRFLWFEQTWSIHVSRLKHKMLSNMSLEINKDLEKVHFQLSLLGSKINKKSIR
jgi:hypothetical protein